MTHLEYAQKYLKIGMHPIPLVEKGKTPLIEWKKFQAEPPDPGMLELWWVDGGRANIGLVLGRGKICVDLDGGSAAEDLLKAAGVTLPADAPRSETGSGFHVFLSVPHAIPDCVGLVSTNGSKPQVDIRGVGYAVVPPSIHPNGKQYKWLVPLRMDPPAAPQSLIDLIAKRNTKPAMVQTGTNWVVDALDGVAEGGRDNVCAKLAGYFLGKKIDIETTKALLNATFAKNCTPAFRDVDKTVDSVARREGVTGVIDRDVETPHLKEICLQVEEDIAGAVPQYANTGFAALDDLFSGGFAPGELVLLAARPGVGKTALALQIARNVAENLGAVLIVSREMVSRALVKRMVSQHSKIRAKGLRAGDLTSEEKGALTRSLSVMSDMPIWLTDQAVTIQEIAGAVSRLSVQQKIKLVVVDYLQLLSSPEQKERRHQIEAISKGLKGIATQFNVPVLCMSSLSRGKDENSRPHLGMLRESGELEYDADAVIFLWRKDEDVIEAIVAKNREGMLGSRDFSFKPDILTFKALDPFTKTQGNLAYQEGTVDYEG